MGVILERLRSWTGGCVPPLKRNGDSRRASKRARAQTYPVPSSDGPQYTYRTRLSCRRARSGEVVVVCERLRLRCDVGAPRAQSCRRARSGEVVVVCERLRLRCDVGAPRAQVLVSAAPEDGSLRSLAVTDVTDAADPSAMGSFLDKPKTDKTNTQGEGLGLAYGIATMQGWRVDMEDAHTSILGIQDPPSPLAHWSFFAVFDGHAGSKVAAHSSSHLLPAILATAEMKEVLQMMAEPDKLDKAKMRELIKAGIRDGFLHLDSSMLKLPEVYGDSERSGSTAIAALITPEEMYIANLGDSRAILARKDDAEPFGTEDHKPYLHKERERIENAGGSVMIQRVNGSLAVSRALGDYEYKAMPGLHATEQQVSPEPDVYVVDREPGRDEFLLLACDGIYDVIQNDELSSFVRSRLVLTHDLPQIANQVLDACLSKGSRDNMSVILVSLPAKPCLDEEARKVDAQLQQQLEARIGELVSEHSAQSGDIDADMVTRHLLSCDIPGLPPGAGIHALRSRIEEVLGRAKAGQLKAAAPASAASAAQS